MEKVLADYAGSPDILVASAVCNPEARGASLCTRHALPTFPSVYLRSPSDEKIGELPDAARPFTHDETVEFITANLGPPESDLCADHPACVDVGLHPLDGLCCPVADGTRLACCDGALSV
jgi:hypothetical protein